MLVDFDNTACQIGITSEQPGEEFLESADGLEKSKGNMPLQWGFAAERGKHAEQFIHGNIVPAEDITLSRAASLHGQEMAIGDVFDIGVTPPLRSIARDAG